MLDGRWFLAVPPPVLPDPLAPVAQDPDAIRDAACRLVFPDVRCSSPSSSGEPPTPRSVDAGPFLQLLQIVFWVLAFAAALALVYVLVRAALRWHSPGRRRRRRETSDSDADETEHLEPRIVDHRRQPSSWRDEADDHRRAGRCRDALRCRYRALVGDLARRRVLDEIPGRTTGEERLQLAQLAPDGSAPFALAADLFDGAWYGQMSVDDGDVEQMVAWETEVLARVPMAGWRR